MGCLIHTPVRHVLLPQSRLSRSLTVAVECFRCLQNAVLRALRKDPPFSRWAVECTSSVLLQLLFGRLTGAGGGPQPCEGRDHVQLCGADGHGVLCREAPYRGTPGKAQNCFQVIMQFDQFWIVEFAPFMTACRASNIYHLY